MKKVITLILILALGSEFIMAQMLSTSYYEGEANTFQKGCNFATSHFPYIGRGYLEIKNNGSFSEWNNINVAKSGKYTIIIKYSNASGYDKQCALSVNGRFIKNIPFKTAYKNWAYYYNARVIVDLERGNNTIKLKANTVNGGPNIDNIAVSSNLISSPSDNLYNVKKFGAKGNGVNNETAAIQAAINACSGTNGTVILDSGTFMCGHIELKSNMTFWISEKAILKAIQDTSLYPASAQPNTNNISVADELGISFIYSNKANNLTITGGGTIDGNGNYSLWDGYKYDESVRPIPVYLTQGNNISFTNLDIIHGAMWTLITLECENVVIDGININSNLTENCDGIDICDSHNVTITNATIVCEDDAICPKSGNMIGVQNLICKNITVNSTLNNYLKFGTKSYGHFKNILVEDMVGNGGFTGISIESVDGADIENITIRRMKMNNVATPLYIIHGAGLRSVTDQLFIPLGEPAKIGSVSNINISDIECRNITSTVGSSILGTIRNGIAYRPTNISLTNFNVQSFKGGITAPPKHPPEYSGGYPEYDNSGNLPAWGYYVRHAANITFTNCTHTVKTFDVRPAIQFFDVKCVTDK